MGGNIRVNLRLVAATAVSYFRHRHYLLPALLAPAYFLPSMLSGRWIYSEDTSDWTYVLRRWAADQWARGEVPLWNPFLHSGVYQAGSAGLGLYSPTLLLYFWFSGPLAMQLSLLLFSAVAAAGMARLVSALTASRVASLFGGIAYAWSGYVLSSTTNYGYFAGAAVYPWAVLAYLHFRRTESPAAGACLALALCWIGLEGDPLGMAIGIAALSVDLLLSWGPGYFRRVTLWSGVILFSLALGAIFIVPAFEAFAQSERAGVFSFEQSSVFSMSPRQLWSWFRPGLYGYFNNGTFSGEALTNALATPRFWVDSIYLGQSTLALGIWGVFAGRKERSTRLAAGLALFFLLLSFGKHFPLHSWFYQAFTFYQKIKYPSRYYAFFNLIWIGLAARGLAAILPRLSARWAWAFVAIAAVDLYLLGPPLRLIAASDLSRQFALGAPLKILRDGLIDKYSPTTLSPRERLSPNWGTLEGVSDVLGYEPTAPRRVLKLLPSRLLQNFPVWSEVLNIEGWLTPARPQEDHAKEWFRQGLVHVDQVWPERNIALLRRNTAYPAVVARSRYEVVHSEEEALEKVSARLPGTRVAILENPVDLAQLSGECPDPIPLEHSLNRARFSVACQHPFILILRENYFTGWKAYARGQKLPVFRADYLNRATLVPAAANEVEFRFEPWSFTVGAWVSGMALLLFGMLQIERLPRLRWVFRKWAPA